MKQLNDQDLSRALIATKSVSRLFEKRKAEGVKLYKGLARQQKQTFQSEFDKGARRIISFANPPRKDGKTYSGEIGVILDDSGYFTFIKFLKKSGNDTLDDAMFNAVKAAKYIELSNNPEVRRAMVAYPLRFTYNETDMAD
jgi:hypothetical protein